MINFVFENLKDLENFQGCPDINPSGLKRFPTAPITHQIVFRAGFHRSFELEPKKFNWFRRKLPDNYIITTGANHHPNDWTGYLGNVKNSFSYLNDTYLSDLRSGKAMLLFDQSLEGYQTPWLWEYFHKECNDYKINPEAIIYVTGNVIAEDQYTDWANDKNIKNRLNIIPFSVFEEDVHTMVEQNDIKISFKEQLKYKKENLEKIKNYNCLQKRLRSHRIWFYKYLYDSNVLKDGMVSMNQFSSRQTSFESRYLDENETQKLNSILPLMVYGKPNNELDDNFYIRRIIKEVYLDTWVSVVSEASFADSDQTIFLSEKIFKPITCFHPFIVVGNKGSLEKIREMGYKTFDGFIDESYDNKSTFDRFESIIQSIKKIEAIDDKYSWYKSMEDILIHNYNTLKKNSKRKNPAVIKLEDCYKRYFKKK